MDIAVLAGILICFVLMLMGIMFADGKIVVANIKMFLDVGSFLIVFGGVVGSSMAGVSLADFIGTMKSTLKVIKPDKIDWEKTVTDFTAMAQEARRDGVLSLQNKIEEQEDPIVKSGLQLIVDGADSEILFQVIGTKIQMKKNTDKTAQKVMAKMGSLAPAFGMLGTVIGLIQVLANLSEPEKLGSGIATAFITTFYGIVFANVFFNPIAEKMNYNNSEKSRFYEMILTGLQSIHEGDNPFMVEEKLKAFCPENQGKKGKAGEEGSENYESAQLQAEAS